MVLNNAYDVNFLFRKEMNQRKWYSARQFPTRLSRDGTVAKTKRLPCLSLTMSFYIAAQNTFGRNHNTTCKLKIVSFGFCFGNNSSAGAPCLQLLSDRVFSTVGATCNYKNLKPPNLY